MGGKISKRYSPYSHDSKRFMNILYEVFTTVIYLDFDVSFFLKIEMLHYVPSEHFKTPLIEQLWMFFNQIFFCIFSVPVFINVTSLDFEVSNIIFKDRNLAEQRKHFKTLLLLQL